MNERSYLLRCSGRYGRRQKSVKYLEKCDSELHTANWVFALFGNVLELFNILRRARNIFKKDLQRGVGWYKLYNRSKTWSKYYHKIFWQGKTNAQMLASSKNLGARSVVTKYSFLQCVVSVYLNRLSIPSSLILALGCQFRSLTLNTNTVASLLLTAFVFTKQKTASWGGDTKSAVIAIFQLSYIIYLSSRLRLDRAVSQTRGSV